MEHHAPNTEKFSYNEEIFTLTKFNSFYFLRKLIVIHIYKEIDRIRTEIYTIQFEQVYRSVEKLIQQPKKNHRLNEIIMIMTSQIKNDLVLSFIYRTDLHLQDIPVVNFIYS